MSSVKKTGPVKHSGKVCIGLSVEGDHLRLASVGLDGSTLQILELASMKLPQMQLAPSIEHDREISKNNPFEEIEEIQEDTIDYGSVKEFIQAHFGRNSTFSISFGEPLIRTFLMPRTKKDSMSSIIKRIVSEIEHAHSTEMSKSQVAFANSGQSSVIASALMERTPLLDVFTAPQGVERRPPKINFLTSNEIALINIVRLHFRFRDDEIVHVIYVGTDETRLLIMRGYNLIHLAPPIQQGANDREYVMMLNNRIELAAENAGFPKAHHIVLGGLAEEIGLKDELRGNNPEMIFHSLTKLRIGHGRDESLNKMSEYVIPISIAWQHLQPKNPHFYRINVLPRHIKEEQNKFKLSWYGFLLLAVLFASTVGVTVLFMQKQAKINELSTALQYEKSQIHEQQEIVQRINDLETRSAAIVNATNTLDTLLVNSERWTETLDTLSTGAAKLKNIWISEMKPNQSGGLAIVGFSINRPSVPTISQEIGEANMQEISVQKIGERKTFRYALDLGLKDEYPYSASRSTLWHDSVSITLGDVDTRFSSSAKKAEAPTRKKKK